MKRKSLLLLFVLCLMTSFVPDSVECVAGEALGGKLLSVDADTENIGTKSGELKLMGLPVKSVEVTVSPRQRLVPCGNAIGIKIETEGVMVVGTNDSFSEKSELMPGDVIIKANGTEVGNTDELREIVSGCNGEEISFEVKREGNLKSVTAQPAKNPVDNSYYIGAWVRDSTAGIGTMTWFDPETGEYGALGHSITDVDTGKIMDVSMGEIVKADIVGANKGSEGSPGLLIGNFLQRKGSIKSNSEYGIRGFIDKGAYPVADAVDVATPSEVEKGRAQILCCIEGTEPVAFDVTIEKVMNGKMWGAKNMVIRIDDQRILSATGGIVQGMSGSPVIQNGKLVGAVTHVFVNDPTRGYGIFIENMLSEAEK